MVTLYTPGHNLITDSLIVHGVLRILGVLGHYSGVVQRVGERFVVDVEGLDHHSASDLGSRFRGTDTYRSLQLALDLYISRNYMPRDQGIGKILESSPGETKKWIKALNESLQNLDLSYYLSPDHIISVGEGRGRGRGLHALYIPLSSIYGKYQALDYSTAAKPYSVCRTCLGLASLGLMYGALTTVVQRENSRYTLFTTIIPGDRIGIADLLIMQRLLEGHRTIGGFGESTVSDIPLLALPLYLLSVGETLAAIESEVDVLTWKVAKVGRRTRSLDTALISLNKLMDFVTEVKMLVPEWPRMVSECFEAEDGFAILSELTERIVFSGDTGSVYSTIRRIASYIEGRSREDITCRRLLEKMHIFSEAVVKSTSKP